MDGTLLRRDQTISDASRRAIIRAQQAGVTVMFATGRGIQAVENYRLELGLESPMVLVNGADLWASPGHHLKRHFLEHDAVRNLHAIAEDNGAHFWAYSAESLTQSDEWTNDMFERQWMKFGIYTDDNNGLIDEIRQTIIGFGEYEVTSSHSSNIEVGPKGITKASGMAHICNYLDLDMEDVMAIGDSPNDLELLKAAGLGVAMENGSDDVKSIADVHTDSNENEGVANAIDRYLLRTA